MSDNLKTAEETQPQVTPVEAPVEHVDNATAAEAPAEAHPEETPVEEPAEAEVGPAADSSDSTTEQPKEEQKGTKEVTFASECVLGYKAPGLVKGLRFSKRFVYFQDEPITVKNLVVYVQNGKSSVTKPLAAWASQTGKGLMFLTKRSEDRATPETIISMADVSEIIKEGNEVHFKVNGHKHAFQVANAEERESWIATLEAKSATAKTEKETIVSSEGYKAELQRLMNPYDVAARRAAENREAKDTKETKEDENVADKEQTSGSKSRSQSRKRASLFSSFLGKKDDADEKKEEKKDKSDETSPAEVSTENNTEALTNESAADEAPAGEVPTGEAPAGEAPASEAPADEAPATEAPTAETAAEVPAATDSDKREIQKDDKKEEKVEKTEEPKEKKVEPRVNTKPKRTSLFGNFFQKVTGSAHQKAEKEATSQSGSSVGSTAPQLDNPVEEVAAKVAEPEAVSASVSAEAAPVSIEDAIPTGETTATNGEALHTSSEATKDQAESPAGVDGMSKEKRRSTSFFGLSSDGESKKGKRGSIFRKVSKVVEGDKEATTTESKPEPLPKVEPTEKPEAVQPAEVPAAESKTTAMPSTSTTIEATA